MKQRKVLNVISVGGTGGTEMLNMEAAGYSKHDNSYVFLFQSGKISDEMILRGYKVEVLNTSPKRYFSDSIRLAKRCKTEKYDAIIFNSNNPMGTVCAFFTKILCKNMGTILHIHSNPVDWTKKDLICSKIIGKLSDKIICISDSVLDSYKKHIGYVSKLVRIYNGVDVKKFQKQIANMQRIEHNGYRMIYVGRLTKGKGVQNILAALSQIQTDFHLDVVGDGEYREQLENLATKLGIAEQVVFHGTQTDIRPFLLNADIFIHVPILEEGFGSTVVEAMAAGLICICSNSGAIPEIIKDGETGYLVDKDNPDQLAQKLQNVMENYYSPENMQIRDIAAEKGGIFSMEEYCTTVDGLVDKTTAYTREGVKLIYVGRLERVKGIQNILKALAEIKDIEFHLTVVGDGNFRQELENLSAELGLCSKVDFLGIRRDIPELLWQSDIFVHLPEWEEGFGITVIEAMAAGCICIVNDHGALPEIITDKVDGYIVRESKDFGRVLREIAADMISCPYKIRRIQSNAIERSRDFTIERYAGEIDRLIENVSLD